MFVRSKSVDGTTYYAVIETYRAGAKVRHRTLASLGTCRTIENALAQAQQQAAAIRRHLAKFPKPGVFRDFDKRREVAERGVDQLGAKVATLKRLAGGTKAAAGKKVGTTGAPVT